MKTIKLLIVLLTLLPALVLAQEKTKTREVELANGDTLTHVTSIDKEDGQVNLYSETDLYNPNKWYGVNDENATDCDVGDRQCIEGARSLLGKDPNIQMHKSMAKIRVEQSPVDAKITKVQTGTEKVQTGIEIKNKVEDKKAADSIQIDPPDPKSDLYTISGATPEHVDAETSASPLK
jgi:hypothetical protein